MDLGSELRIHAAFNPSHHGSMPTFEGRHFEGHTSVTLSLKFSFRGLEEEVDSVYNFTSAISTIHVLNLDSDRHHYIHTSGWLPTPAQSFITKLN